MSAPAAPGHERLLKELAPRVLGTLVRRYGDFETCEDAVQEALLAAARTWPRDGTPDDPGAWLARVASRRAIDAFRRDSARRRREAAVAVAADEAIRLTRMLHAGLPEAPEAAGLLALMLLTHARRRARTGPRGELVPLQSQDRSLWDRGEIEEGVALVSATLPKGSIGPYQLQAAIAALHDEAPRSEDTDWPQILALYGVYRRISDHPMVALNHGIATAMVHGPERGLELLGALEGDRHLAAGHRLDAVRAHLLEMAGDRAEALERYRRAAARATNLPERNYLLARAAELAEGPAGTGGGSG